jgi:GNAT superfamily N-acetyltransferase
LSIELVRYSERPELWAATGDISAEVWPEYNLHGDVLNAYWRQLPSEFPDYQFCLYDAREEDVVAEGHTAPCPWDRTPEGLGDGIDAMLVAALDAHRTGRRPDALCALAAEIRPRFRGRGLANEVLAAMVVLAREADLPYLIAPVRPSFKDRYPITPIERYVTWTDENGEPFDPWIRVHVRVGGRLVKPVPRSMRITGTVAEWEAWTGMRFPDDGAYTFPAGLAPVEIDRGRDVGEYWEPNVWIVHVVSAQANS